MIRENTRNLSDIKLFLVITTILLSMFMGFLLAGAQETYDNDNWEKAKFLFPNGDSLYNTFLSKQEKDWYKFVAKQGVTYQIFTRPVKGNNPPETVIYLYSDPTSSDFELKSNIEYDGSAFIEWTSPSSDLYFVSAQARDPNIYGVREAYTIQITSIDYQNDHTIIPDVPDYSQSDFRYYWDCKVVSAACVLGYWDSHGYSLLVDSNPDCIEDVKRLVSELNEAMEFSMKMSLSNSLTDENVREGIEMYSNLPQYGNNYNFVVEYYPFPAFSKVFNEIENKRPVLYGVIGHSIWGNHWMVTVGYLKTGTTDWTINHDNWRSTHKDIYVDWDEATDCIITIHPDNRKKFLITSHPDIYSVYQYTPYPVVYPWLETLPTISFGTINTFSGINNMPFFSWFSNSNTGYPKYSNQFDSGGSAGIGWLGNPELNNDQRYMAWDVNVSSLSSYGYNNSIGYDNTDGYNYATGNSNIISNPTYSTYLGFDFNVNSFTNLPFQGPLSPLDSLFLSPFQTFFPTLGLLPYNVFSPFPSLSPGPFLFGFPF